MENSKSKFVILLLSLLLVSYMSFGQKGVDDGSKYGHGADSVRCIRGLSLSHDFIKQKDFAMAYPYWKVIFDECPLSSKNIYIDGVKLYRDLISRAEEDTRKAELLDTLMLIYDRRLTYFGEKGNVRGRQGVDLLRYGREKIENIEQAYGFLKESVDMRKQKASNAVLASFISSSIILFQNEKTSAGQVIEDYLEVSELLDLKIAKKPKTRSLKLTIDKNFIEGGPSQCAELIEYFDPLLESKKEDIAFLQMLTAILRDRDCTDSESFFSASKYLHPLSPSSESALNIAIMAFMNNDYTEAMEYYQQALQLETEEEKKADYYFGIAACYRSLDNKQSAREFAGKAITVRPNWGEPYILIGQLYADSKKSCSSIKLPNSVYWAAVDKFNTAKNVDPSVAEKANSLILTYSRYFPLKEEAFFEKVHEGTSYKVECWINETTKARFNK